MNFNKKLIFILTLNLLISSPVWSSSIYDDFKKELIVRFESIKQSKGLVTKETIFSSNVIEKTWYLTKNQPLDTAGESLILFLQEYDEVYNNFEFPEWINATNDLFIVDDYLSKHVGWGNLVIKVAICNKVINRVLGYLNAQDKLTSEQLDSLLHILEKLRSHLPSEKAMYYILFRHYNLEIPFKVNSLNYNNISSPEDSPTAVRSSMSKYYYKNKEAREVIDSKEKSESALSESIFNYQDLYNKPIPLYLTVTSRYHNILWHIYFHIYMKINAKDNEVDWSVITEEEVLETLDKIYAAESKFWIGKYHKDFFDNRDNNEVKTSLMKYFKEDRVMKKLLKNNAEISNNGKTKSKASRFSVHSLR